MKHFYSEILQERTNQIDNIQLYETWLFLTILYGGHSILKQVTTARLRLSDNTMIKILQLIPFFSETFLLLKIIGYKIEIYKLKQAIQAKVDQIGCTETASINWKRIGEDSLKISKRKQEIDQNSQQLAEVDVYSSLSNTLQGNTFV